MEEKNKFGAYIREKRNARGLSQKDLASRLYITESAVSKWERGKSYPDITLITLLCEILQVSEHELITASDDVQQRLNEMQARKYRTFTKVMTILMYVMYAAILIPTLLSQIFQHSGELWWPILLSCMALLFSGLTVPTVLAHQNRGWWTLMSFLFSSELLTFSVWLYQRSVRAASFTGGFALLDTHYYGGIKKYQWVAIPLAIHGVIVKKDGTVVKVAVGEKPEDPVFFVSDLLIHLAQEQMNKKATTVVEGEALDVIVGNQPIKVGRNVKEEDKKSAGKEAVKKGVLAILKKQFGVEEEDFLSAELEVVPAGRAREAGFDRSMVLSYGQDDRVCAYGSYKAMLDVKDVSRTACCILVDKEEIGSVGATGMQSMFFENTVAELLELLGKGTDLALRRTLTNSTMLSSDVSSAFDPLYASAFDKKNVAYFGKGLVLNKFTGARGKSGSNDANAEYIAHIRSIFAKEKINFQMSELGKVDLGGGGTIAYIMALYGMNVIDSGVPVLSMHAPWEATSKADIYEARRGYEAFLKLAKRV